MDIKRDERMTDSLMTELKTLSIAIEDKIGLVKSIILGKDEEDPDFKPKI